QSRQAREQPVTPIRPQTSVRRPALDPTPEASQQPQHARATRASFNPLLLIRVCVSACACDAGSPFPEKKGHHEAEELQGASRRTAGGLRGRWMEPDEGAKFWLEVLTEMKPRGVDGVFLISRA